jgi:HEAT repeat protein
LAFVSKYGEEQLKQIPVAGPLLTAAGAGLLAVAAEPDNEAFEQRLEQLLTVGEETNDNIKALMALAAFMFDQQAMLIQELGREGLAVEQRELSELATSTALTAYRHRIRHDYQNADYRGVEGVTRAEQACSLPLDDVYIVPKLHPQRAVTDSRGREREVLQSLLDDPDLSDGRRCDLEEEYAGLSAERWGSEGEKQGSGVELREALTTARHLVILGGPGVGKSTLIRFLARQCAAGPRELQERLGWAEDLTPVVVPLAAFADARRTQSDLDLRGFIDQQMMVRGEEALRNAVRQEFDNGCVFALLDGVDEIPGSAERSSIVREVESFMAGLGANRCLVSSRPYGYIQIAGNPAQYELSVFSPEQVESFVRAWQRAFDRWRQHGSANVEEADAEAEEMLAEIKRNPKVAELATNPLILVIISLIRSENTRLPEQRVELYYRAVKTLLDTWNYWRSMSKTNVGGISLPLDRLLRACSGLAEWLRRTKPTGVAHRAELQRELSAILKDKEYDDGDPDRTAESYLSAAADRAGLLEERGPGIFAFWHPTFEEFLAAVELATPTARATERLLPLRDDARWREVILLAVGYIGISLHDPETATEVVRAIAEDEPGPLEPLLHSHLLLAAACVADDVGVKRSYGEKIVCRLANVIQKQPYAPFTTTFVATVRALPQLKLSAEAVGKLAPVAEFDEWEPRMEAARLFSNVAATNPQAHELCDSLLKDDDPDVRCHAALGLARAGDVRVEVWKALAHYSSSYAHIEASVRQFLSDADDRVVEALRSCLTHEDHDLRVRAADLLVRMERADDGVVEALRSCLTHENRSLRVHAADILVRMERVDDGVVEALRSCLTHEDHSLRVRAADILVRMERVSEGAMETLVKMATSSPWGRRQHAQRRVTADLSAPTTGRHWRSWLREGTTTTRASRRFGECCSVGSEGRWNLPATLRTNRSSSSRPVGLCRSRQEHVLPMARGELLALFRRGLHVENPKLKPRRLGHAFHVPRRIPHDLKFDVCHAWDGLDRGLRLHRQNLRDGACGRRKRHVDIDAAVVFDINAVDEAHLVDIDGDLRVVDRLQSDDDLLFDLRYAHQPCEVGFFGHAFAPSYSVVTGSCLFSIAAFSVCQQSVAHFTRIGYSLTPWKAMSLPMSGPSSVASALPKTSSWNTSNSSATSPRGFPLSASVISDADAVEMAQPTPSKCTSSIRSSSTVR